MVSPEVHRRNREIFDNNSQTSSLFDENSQDGVVFNSSKQTIVTEANDHLNEQFIDELVRIGTTVSMKLRREKNECFDRLGRLLGGKKVAHIVRRIDARREEMKATRKSGLHSTTRSSIAVKSDLIMPLDDTIRGEMKATEKSSLNSTTRGSVAIDFDLNQPLDETIQQEIIRIAFEVSPAERRACLPCFDRRGLLHGSLNLKNPQYKDLRVLIKKRNGGRWPLEELNAAVPRPVDDDTQQQSLNKNVERTTLGDSSLVHGESTIDLESSRKRAHYSENSNDYHAKKVKGDYRQNMRTRTSRTDQSRTDVEDAVLLSTPSGLRNGRARLRSSTAAAGTQLSLAEDQYNSVQKVLMRKAASRPTRTQQPRLQQKPTKFSDNTVEIDDTLTHLATQERDCSSPLGIDQSSSEDIICGGPANDERCFIGRFNKEHLEKRIGIRVEDAKAEEALNGFWSCPECSTKRLVQSPNSTAFDPRLQLLRPKFGTDTLDDDELQQSLDQLKGVLQQYLGLAHCKILPINMRRPPILPIRELWDQVPDSRSEEQKIFFAVLTQMLGNLPESQLKERTTQYPLQGLSHGDWAEAILVYTFYDFVFNSGELFDDAKLWRKTLRDIRPANFVEMDIQDNRIRTMREPSGSFQSRRASQYESHIKKLNAVMGHLVGDIDDTHQLHPTIADLACNLKANISAYTGFYEAIMPIIGNKFDPKLHELDTHVDSVTDDRILIVTMVGIRFRMPGKDWRVCSKAKVLLWPSNEKTQTSSPALNQCVLPEVSSREDKSKELIFRDLT